MVISPPFLPSPIAGETESAFLARAMVQPYAPARNTSALRGSFPLAGSLMWHNGLHLGAPQIDGRFVPVRAIADGKVIHVRQPAQFSSDPEHPLNHASDGGAHWTDNGCVIVKHSTDIGAARGVPVSFSYFSLTMHLSAIEPAVKVGAQVWRKDLLGKAGQVLGGQSTIHFEICCDTAQLKQLIGRDPAWIELENEAAPTRNGRTDCVYGDTVIYLPASTAIAHQKPWDPHRTVPGRQTQLNTAQWVVMKYEKGNLTIRSLDRMGRAIGTPQVVVDAEYDLYKTACALHAKSRRDDVANSPSGWYELLRFGRNLGPDPLPTDAANWQCIPTATGTVWADLNYPDTFKFSEADFLTVMDWKIVNDDRDHLDQRAQSLQMSRLLQDPTPNSPEREKPGHQASRVGLPEVVAKLKNVIAYFPTEWDITTAERRVGWLKDKKQVERPMDEKQWGKFKNNFDALCMPDLPEEYKNAMWRINPVTFIETMRKCSWLSQTEFLQLIPEYIVRGKGAGLRGPFFYERSEKKAGRLTSTYGHELNKMMRKYGICDPLRATAFIGNSNPEAIWWSGLEEDGGRTLRYFPWHGRGFLQLTNPDGKFSKNSNYEKYFLFRGFDVEGATNAQLAAWRDAAGKEAYAASESAGAYWAWMNTNKIADRQSLNTCMEISLDLQSQIAPGGKKIIYENIGFRQVACAINLPAATYSAHPKLNGLTDRYSAYTVAQLVLMDLVKFPRLNGQESFLPENFSSRSKK
jgi:murein DD-endopeptidase MepM/ murein hydrolase activator NlpD